MFLIMACFHLNGLGLSDWLPYFVSLCQQILPTNNQNVATQSSAQDLPSMSRYDQDRAMTEWASKNCRDVESVIEHRN